MFTAPEQPLDYLHDKIDTAKGALGLAYVGYGDELPTEYPSAILSAMPVVRELHATRQFQIQFRVAITVLHADYTQTRQERTRQDLLLATGIRNMIHEDMKLGGNIVHGFIEAETPGVVASQSRVAVASLLSWFGISVVGFTEV